MAQFKGTLTGQTGHAVRLGNKASGLVAQIKGWDSGVLVEAFYDEVEGRDVFKIYQIKVNAFGTNDKRELLARVFGTREGRNNETK